MTPEENPSWLPQIHCHQWSQWSEPVQTLTARKQQWRVCKHCNKAKFRTLGWDDHSALHSVLEVIRAIRSKEQS